MEVADKLCGIKGVSIKQIGGWIYASNEAGDQYTLNRAYSNETYGTSLVKRTSLSGTVKYCVEWNTVYGYISTDSFNF